MTSLVWLIPALPFSAFVINIFFGKQTGEKAGLISVAASLLACAAGVTLISPVMNHTVLTASLPWFQAGDALLRFGYQIDPLAATLLFVVLTAGTLIQIYSIGYMHGDPRYSRFFAYVSLFMSAMLLLVISDNYLLFFIAWEIMGLCSYLLIGYWFEKDSAADASLKAFLTTRIGDVGFFLGILAVFFITGTLNFAEVAKALDPHVNSGILQNPMVPIAALLIFCGTIGKSAQVPLHVWLPDAMEGPTSVSALIHAATMVAAGVYLLARTFAIFMFFPNVLLIIALIGTATALMAAFIALTQTDIKKVLAYSTVSQLGFMVAAVGLNCPQAAIFHLMTHAFFKALLFLGAGSVIHGTGTQDIRELGGLFGKMKSTAVTFLIGSLAIAGVPPLAGFWSKDEILLSAFQESQWIYLALSLAAFMTAFYMFRLVFLTFFGKARNSHIHAHESPAVMTLPLWALAVGSIVIGLPGSVWMHHAFQHFLSLGHESEAAGGAAGMVMTLSILIGLAGIATAFLFYVAAPVIPNTLARIFKPLHTLSYNKIYFDELYSAVLIRPFNHLADRVLAWFDQRVIDGLVNFAGTFTGLASALVRRLQSGLVQNYLLILFAGVLCLLYLDGR